MKGGGQESDSAPLSDSVVDNVSLDVEVGESVNYYIELEQIKLDLNENTVATLKDIRNIASQ